MILRRAALPLVAVVLLAGAAEAQQKLEPLPPVPSSSTPPLPPPSSAPPSSAPPGNTPPSTPAGSDFGVPDVAPPSSPSPAPAPIADGAPEPSPSRLSRREFRPSFKGAAGFQYAPVHGIPVTGARLRLGVGAQNDSSAHYASLNILYGGTDAGLPTWDVRVAWNADLLRTGILRLGIDVEMGYLVIRRATVDAHLWALGMGGGIHASVDAYSFGPRDDHAIYLEAKLDAHLHFGNAFVWGPSILAGFRY